MRAKILQKVLATVLALGAALSMAACSGNPAPDASSASGVSSAVEQPREESSAAEESEASDSAAEESEASDSAADEPEASDSAAEVPEASAAEEPKTSGSAPESSESSGAQVPAMEAPSWETQRFSFDSVTFELPASWKKVEESSTETQEVYIPSNTSGSNISIIYTGASIDEDISDAFEQLTAETEAMLATRVEESSNFKSEPVKLPCGDALKMSYTLSLDNGIALGMTQYYIITSSMVVTIANVGEELTPPIDEVAAYMLYTLKED